MNLSSAVLTCSLCLLLVACGDKDKDKAVILPTMPPTAGEQTLDQKIADLERSGALPVLDRSSSIPGPDANANGIRDDVETYINGQLYSAPQKQAAMQTAKSLQAMMLVDTSDKAATDAVSLTSGRAIHCLVTRFPVGSAVDPERVVKDLEKVTANTEARIRAYLKYSAARDGTVSTVLREDSCE